jgi:hypothetical protein
VLPGGPATAVCCRCSWPKWCLERALRHKGPCGRWHTGGDLGRPGRPEGRNRAAFRRDHGLADALASNAFTQGLPAPVPAELRALGPAEAHRALASRLGLASDDGRELDLSNSFGPFLRCFDVEVPLWLPTFSVPDIAFVVTQDLSGDGTQTVIYDGAFDAEWDAWPIATVELDVSQAAIASPFPGCPPVGVPCGNEPAITQISYLDVNADYLDPELGFAVRMNQPSPSAFPSSAPFEGTIPLFGCTTDAPYYRVLASWADSDGLVPAASPPAPPNTLAPLPSSAFGPQVPVVAEPWQVALGATVSPPITADAEGWYSTEYLTWNPPNLLVNWTPADGVYQLTLEVGDGTPGSVTPTGSSPSIPIVVDSTPPGYTFYASQWSSDGGTTWSPITNDDGCLIIERPEGTDIQVQLTYTVSAGHLYSVSLFPDGCNDSGVSVAPTSPPPPDFVYDSPFNNSAGGTVIYTIAGTAPEGCYSWALYASSRAFSPNDASGLTEFAGLAWNYPPTPSVGPLWSTPIWVEPTVTIAVVDL